MANVGPIEIHQALAGCSFPASKQQILDHVDGQGGHDLARSMLDELPDGDYASIAEIDTALADTHY